MGMDTANYIRADGENFSNRLEYESAKPLTFSEAEVWAGLQEKLGLASWPWDKAGFLT